jgi:rubrerythrin
MEQRPVLFNNLRKSLQKGQKLLNISNVISIGDAMTLEEAIQTAISYENKVRDVYRQAEKEASTPEAKKFFRILGDEEQDHVDYLEAKLAEWKEKGKVTPGELATAVPSTRVIEEKAKALQSKALGKSSALETDLLSQALEVETETSGFYRRMVGELSPVERTLFERFLEIEEGHLAIVQAEMNLAANFGVWFDLQEFVL